LKNAKIPKYDEKEGKVLYGQLSEKGLPLTKELPISLTVHKIGEHLIVDPNREEEDVSETRVTIGGFGDTISSMQKGAEESLSIEEMGKILDMSDKVRKDLNLKIEKSLK
jgi:exosome complex RNA-binding protein Rrp42 (RNase PH superfamily)